MPRRPPAHGSYEALAADPEVDVAYVATPHNIHRPCAVLALRAGKHVLVEKPLALSALEGEDTAAVSTARSPSSRLIPAARSRPCTRPRSADSEVGHRALHHQAATVASAVAAGAVECPQRPLADSLGMLRVLEEIRRQIGVTFEEERTSPSAG